MGGRVFGYAAALLWLALPIEAGTATAGETYADVKGIVRVEGRVPPPREWELDEAVRRVTGEKVYREETWLVGEGMGLAHCVVTLRPTSATPKAIPRPLEKAVVDKVGVRYVPRVLVVTPGTEVILRNKESPCRGFQIQGGPRYGHAFNYMVGEGGEQKVTLRGPDICQVGCPSRPYVRGYIVVVDTPYFGVTDAKGTFTIRGVPAGEYRAEVWHEAAGKLVNAGPAEVTVTGERNETLRYRVKPPSAEGN